MFGAGLAVKAEAFSRVLLLHGPDWIEASTMPPDLLCPEKARTLLDVSTHLRTTINVLDAACPSVLKVSERGDDPVGLAHEKSELTAVVHGLNSCTACSLWALDQSSKRLIQAPV
jgi:hypothetical protein